VAYMDGTSRARNVPQYIKDQLPSVCADCGTNGKLEYHHIIPYADGGCMSLDNIVQLCHECHMERHRKIREAEHEEQKKRYEKFLDAFLRREV